jgi:hypothetical protein
MLLSGQVSLPARSMGRAAQAIACLKETRQAIATVFATAFHSGIVYRFCIRVAIFVAKTI